MCWTGPQIKDGRAVEMAKRADLELAEFAAEAADGKCKVFLATKS